MPREVRRAALTPGCSLFGRVMTVSEPPKVNDVHNVSLSNEPSHKDVLPWDSKATLLQGKNKQIYHYGYYVVTITSTSGKK